MAADIDVLFVNPSNRTTTYQSLSTTLAAAEPPVWAGLMASYVERKGLRAAILDASAENLTALQTVSKIVEIGPRLVILVIYGHQPSASTQVMPGARAIAAGLKETAPEIPILMVGGHVAALPERTLLEEPVDYIALGEGLVTIAELATALRDGGLRVGGIAGLGYLENGEPVLNPPAPLVQNLDEVMPGPAWHLLSMDLYRAHNWHCFGGINREPYAAIYTTLGCPYHCEFCCIQAPFKSGEKTIGMKEKTNSYRFWSIPVVLDQLGLLVEKYGISNIKFADEMFVLNRKHITGLCRGIIERGYRLNIWAYARIDTVEDDLLDLMKSAGINWLALGIESADAHVRKASRKDFDQERIFKVVRRIQDAGINVIGNYIFGLPEDSMETMQATLRMSIDLRTEFANFYCAMAYPGSMLYTRALGENWPLPAQWSGYSQHSKDSLPLPTRHLPASEVLKFRDEAFKVYFNDKSYLDFVERKFGIETVREIQEMLTFKLERNNAAQPSIAAAGSIP